MQEIWLKTNRRALLLGFILPLVMTAFGAWILIKASDEHRQIWKWVGAMVVVLSVVVFITLVSQFRRPRIAFRDGHVMFYLQGGAPIAVPVQVVESFFAGQSDAHLPGFAKHQQSVNLIVRLARRNTEWAQRTVKPALGKWDDSYVTIRGTWCEPLDTDVIRRLNRRLKEVKEEFGKAHHD